MSFPYPILYPRSHKATRTPTHKGHTMRTRLIFLLLLVASTADACTNITGVTLDGDYRMASGESHVDLLRARMLAKPSSKLTTLEGGKQDHYELEIDFVANPEAAELDAVRDILTGNYAAAIEKLQALESATPGHYSTAANLGTAYELAGDNQNALHWITEGIKRNEDSHYGTEWLHKKILEAKIALESDPDYLKKNPILPFAESPVQDHQFTFDYEKRKLSRDDLLKALHYQLGERMLFVKPTDPVVADLLYSFAILEANTRVLEPAVELLQLAKEYGYHDTANLDARMARYQQTIDSTWKITPGHVISGIFMLVLLSLPLLLLGFVARAVIRRIRARRDSVAP